MTKFEYKIYDDMDDEEAIEMCLDALGGAGWELVSVVALPHGVGLRYFLKREIYNDA